MIQKIKYFIRSVILPDRLFLISKNKRDKSIYLTFDDGPVEGVTDKLLDLLAAYNAQATFFILGSCAEQHPELLTRIVDGGHQIANHSFSHADFTKFTKKQQDNEICRTNELIESTTGARCLLFRAPQGRWNAKLLFLLFKKKMIAVHWNKDSMDFKKESPQRLISRFEQHPVNAGDIILFHDDDDRCIEALARLIPLWQAQGYTLKALES